MTYLKSPAVRAAALVLLMAGAAWSQTSPAPEPPAEAADLSLEQVIGKLQDNYAAIKSYQAEFDQEIYSMTQGRVISKNQGSIIYKKPSRMVWYYQTPEEHLYVTSGDTIWDYSPEDKEVYVLPVKDALYKSFILGLGDLKKEFEISFHSGKKRNSQGYYQLDLIPKDKAERESLGIIMMLVDPSSFLVLTTEIVDALGNRNRITFREIVKNPELDDSKFKFVAPPGVKVIRADEAVPAGSP